jgi:hypothetical protein
MLLDLDLSSGTIIALATVVLALATFWVARSTQSVAREAKNQTSADWRPLLWIRPAATDSGISPDVSYDTATKSLTVGIDNIGRGPALKVWATLYPGAGPNDRRDTWAPSGAYAPGDRFSLTWQGFVPPGPLTVGGEMTYGDIEGVRHATDFTLELPKGSRGQVGIQHYRPPGHKPWQGLAVVHVPKRRWPVRLAYGVKAWWEDSVRGWGRLFTS